MMRRAAFGTALFIAIGAVLIGMARAADEGPDPQQENVLIAADQVTYDEQLGVVVARGNVEIAQAGRVLMADTVTYNQRDDLMTATGDITLLEPTGEVAFADYIQLSDQMKEGVLHDLKLLLTDKSRMAAASARRTGGKRTEMDRAVYSPCNLCIDNPKRAPLWQIKAMRVIHDQEAQDVAYYDAWMEIFGIPVLYTPYFQHPDPTVDRRSGFLAPEYGTSSSLGLELTTPYYWNIAPHRDATIEPRFTSEEGVVLGGEYRERMASGSATTEASLTYTDKRDDDGVEIDGSEFRGHIFSHGDFDLNPVWRWGYQLERATDDTYLSRYRIASNDTLITQPYVEGFNGNNYFAGNAFLFQGLDEGDDQDQIPIVLPMLEFSHVGEPGWAGSTKTFDANVLLLQRIDGTDSRRVSVEGGWHLPATSPGGHVWRMSLTMRGDVYHTNNVVNPRDPRTETNSGITGRLRPEAMLEWRYPLIRQSGTVRHVLEPVVQGIVSPYGGNPVEIPNEDSQDFEFNDTNLFSNSRFTGLDRLESGPRVNYGLRYGAYGVSGGRTTALIGQSARLKDDDTFGPGSGLEDQFSDYVGRLLVAPSDHLSLAYRFRLDRVTVQARRNEIDLSGGVKLLRLNIGYALLEEQLSESDTTGFANREEIVGSFVSRFSEFWRANGSIRRDLTGSGQTLSWSSGLTYEDECIVFVTNYGRTFTRDRDVEPDTTLLFKVQFKHLG